MSGQRDGLSREELQRLAHWDSPPLNAIVASIVARREAAAAAEAVEKALREAAEALRRMSSPKGIAARVLTLGREFAADWLMDRSVDVRGREEAGR